MARADRGPKKSRTLAEELAELLESIFVPDLTQRARHPKVETALRGCYDEERAKSQTATTFAEWVEEAVEQIGAAWILSCIFVRTLEDRGLIERQRLAGEGALDSQQQFFEIAPSLTERDYILTIFRELASFPGVADVLGPIHNPAWRLSPSNDSVRSLLALLRQPGDGGLRFRFEGTDTRFLGDLYEHLSARVSKRLALRQTPPFIEQFILDHTLDAALKEFGREAVRVIDPTCGSGHFLLGAFHRLFEAHSRALPNIDPRDHASRALAQIYGVDVNPYAVAIAKFRLVLMYLECAEIAKLNQSPRIETNLIVADSLLHGGGQRHIAEGVAHDKAAWGGQYFELRDEVQARRLFAQHYHAVVGNPPYVTCKDAALKALYRERYESASERFTLSTPFTERFFQLASNGGFIGMINSNSFAKRDFGQDLVQIVLPRYDLHDAIDLQSVSIPGNDTPSLILFGRGRRPVSDSVRVVLYKRGEGDVPGGAGPAWKAIANHFDEPGYQDDYIAVRLVSREVISRWPWTLEAGMAEAVLARIESHGQPLGSMVGSIGFDTITRAGELLELDRRVYARCGVEEEWLQEHITGEAVRDWHCQSDTRIPVVYDRITQEIAILKSDSGLARFLWPHRFWLRSRFVSGGTRMTDMTPPLPYWGIPQFSARKRRQGPNSITFPFVSSHNHFALDRDGKTFDRVAPILKPLTRSTTNDNLGLIAYLNSSVAAYWFRKVLFPKGGDKTSDGGRTAGEPWERHLEYAGNLMGNLPVPDQAARDALLPLSCELDRMAVARRQVHPNNWMPSFDGNLGMLQNLIETNRTTWIELTERMVYLQEELDWRVYGLMGFEAGPQGSIEGRARPEWRPFERHLAASGEPTAWFERHARTPGALDTIPEEIRGLYRQREEMLATSQELAVLERPECKRRWEPQDYQVLVRDAAVARFLDVVEESFSKRRANTTIAITLRTLGDKLDDLPVIRALIEVLGFTDIGTALVEIIGREQVPFVSSLRFSDTGWNKRRHWQTMWELQRQEDVSGETLAMDTPQKYVTKDYSNTRYWTLRGALDVPRERFISYPGGERDEDKSPLIGWAGWNHLERAQVLAALFQERKEQDGWEAERLAPILAGLLELVAWVKQWHNEPDPAYDGQRMGDVYEAFVSEKARELRVTLDDLRNWRPQPKQANAKKPKAASTSSDAVAPKRARRKKAAADDTTE